MTDIPKFSFAIIHHRGSPNEATVDDDYGEYKVHRQEQVFLGGRMIKCAPDDLHFVYVDPSKQIGRWSPMCTCGSPAVVVGYNPYAKHASPTTRNESSIPGEMAVCYIFLNTGKHADGSG